MHNYNTDNIVRGPVRIFPQVWPKLMLMMSSIENIIDDFCRKDYKEWKEVECRYCKDGNLCRKHLTLEKAFNAIDVVEILGIDADYDVVEGVYLRSNILSVFRKDTEAMLAINFPPFIVDGVQMTDKWVRKVTPFSIPIDSSKRPTLKIHQKVEIDTLMNRHNGFQTSIKKDNGCELNLILSDMFGTFTWEVQELMVRGTTY